MIDARVSRTDETGLTTQEAVVHWLTQNSGSIALPAHISHDRLRWETVMAIRKNPALEKCNFTSLLNAVLQVASYGLYPGPLAHLVPFKGEVVPIIDYKGMVELVVAGGASKIEARVVRGGDEFEVIQGTAPAIHHRVTGFSTRPWTHVYAVVWLTGGVTQFEVMDKAQVFAIRARSPAVRGGSTSPWKTDEEAMALKTVIRRVAKYVPKQTRQLAVALSFEDEMDTTGYIPTPELDASKIAPIPQHVIPTEAGPRDPEELKRGLEALGLAPDGEGPSAASQAVSEGVDEETGEIGGGEEGEGPRSKILETCPKHGVDWVEAKFGPVHPIGPPGGPLCALNRLLVEYKGHSVGLLGWTTKEEQDFVKDHMGVSFSRLDAERKFAVVESLRAKAGLATL